MEVSESVDDKHVMVLMTKQEAMELYAWLKRKWPSSQVGNELVSALRKVVVKETT